MKEPAKNWWVRMQGKFLDQFPEFLRFMVRS
jgi:Flp pilus assembly protein TadB